MPSAARKGRRVRVSRAGVVTRSLTPHTIAISDSYFFVLARNATDNFAIRVPTRALLQLLGIPKNHAVDGGVLDIDPETTEFSYRGKYPKFLDTPEEDAEEEVGG